MKKIPQTKRMDRTLFTVLASFFYLPLFFIFAHATFPQSGWLNSDWLQNRTLWSVEPLQKAPWSWTSFFSAHYQAGATEDFARTFPGRECLARLYNEFYFRTFKQSSMPERFLAGHDNQLFETAYLREYFLERPEAETLEVLVRDITTLQEACRKSGLPFVLVITPSKAATFPEYTPPVWQSRMDPRPRGYDLIVELLKKYGVCFIDGPQLAREEKKAGDPRAPIFPKGGSHWGSTVALRTTNVLVERLREQGLPLEKLETQTFFSEDPYSTQDDSDNETREWDILSALNLALPWQYPVARQTVLPTTRPQTKKFTAVFVGGSFLYRTVHQLIVSQQFSEIDYYFYYDYVISYLLSGKEPLQMNVEPVDFGRDIFAADALILEINEQRIPAPFHLQRFLKDVLPNLPSSREAKKAFHYRSWPRIEWGKPLNYFSNAGSETVQHATTTGFSSFQETYIWSDGKTAQVIMILPEMVGKDVVLQAKVGAFIDAKLPQQKVAVYANDEKVADWIFTGDRNGGIRSIPLPKALLAQKGDRLLTIRFEIDQPTSPSELGLSPDKRKLGIQLHDIRLSPLGSSD